MDIREKYPHFKTRDFDNTIPEFNSHEDARKWFKEQFGNDFMMVDSIKPEDEKIYIYHLVVNKKDYKDYMNYLKEQQESEMLQITEENGAITERGMFSYHNVEIWESGGVHVVY